MTRLTKKRLEAIIEALTSRAAGERDIDVDADGSEPTQDDYETALDWAQDQLDKRMLVTREHLREQIASDPDIGGAI